MDLLKRLIYNRLIDVLFMYKKNGLKPQQWTIPFILVSSWLLNLDIRLRIIILLCITIYTLYIENNAIVNRSISLSLLLISPFIEKSAIDNSILWTILFVLVMYENLFCIRKRKKHEKYILYHNIEQMMSTNTQEKFLLDDDYDNIY